MTSLYLSRLAPNSRHRGVQRDLADCYAMHQRILSGFPNGALHEHAREQFGVLFRVDQGRDGPVMLVQSRALPDWTRLPTTYLAEPAMLKQIDSTYDALETGMMLVFRLRANAVKRISNRNLTQGERWRGKRVELRGEKDQLEWLSRKGNEAGFRLVTVQARSGLNDEASTVESRTGEGGDARIAVGAVVHGARREGDADRQKLTFGATTFDGRLIITDAQRFRRVLEVGVGTGKAFGFGLLSIAPIASVGI